MNKTSTPLCTFYDFFSFPCLVRSALSLGHANSTDDASFSAESALGRAGHLASPGDLQNAFQSFSEQKSLGFSYGRITNSITCLLYMQITTMDFLLLIMMVKLPGHFLRYVVTTILAMVGSVHFVYY